MKKKKKKLEQAYETLFWKTMSGNTVGPNCYVNQPNYPTKWLIVSNAQLKAQMKYNLLRKWNYGIVPLCMGVGTQFVHLLFVLVEFYLSFSLSLHFPVLSFLSLYRVVSKDNSNEKKKVENYISES